MEALTPEDPRSAGAYRLIARLGEGGMGRVFLGRSERGRTVAVKLVHPELVRDPAARRRFRHEVEAARRVGGEFTAAVLDADTESDAPWVATAYVPGPSLQDVVESHGPLPEASVRALAAGLARALAAVHGNDLIHRDVKPSNVLVTIDGPRLIDFGIARSVDSGLGTRTGGVVGSPGFMSPEQVRGTPLTPASDVFSLGAVLAFAATGRQPFGSGGVHARMFRIVSEPADLDGLDGPVRDLVDRCLAKEPDARPALGDLLTGPLADPPAGAWLPAGVMAELGRHTARLLEVEDPRAETGEAREPGPVPRTPSTAPPSTEVTTAGPPPAGTRDVSTRRRGKSFYIGMGAAAAAVVVMAGLVSILLQNRGGAGTAADASGEVPLGMVGTWEGRAGGLEQPSPRLRRLTLRRGAVGDEVAVLYAADGGSLCEYAGDLEEGGTTVRLDMQERRARSDSCARMEVTLTLEDGKVRWAGPGPAEVLSLARNHTIPERLRGVWQWGGAGGTTARTIELGSGDVGTDAVGINRTAPDGSTCTVEATLLSAETEIVFYSDEPVSGRCAPSGLQKIAPAGGGAARWESLTRGESGPLRQYQH